MHDILIPAVSASQVEESVAEEEVYSEERIPHHLTRHSKQTVERNTR